MENNASDDLVLPGTQPEMGDYSGGVENIKRDSWLKQTLAETWFLFTNWKVNVEMNKQPFINLGYVVPLAINLSGSAVYYYTLSSAEITIAVPITNSLALIFTILAGVLIGEKLPTPKEMFGMACIVLGVALCVTG
ncbi:UPF0546 membrane protein C1orf91 [Linderina pennispora]|uniref:UPF0546 membrane protein C1orf91 n=1 Tax=Linderina pennispora TaxID=61395 RepID=A0A1Y1WD69_9FUNG|nr:UPF0546 membrane protein C1orf91 [Linderina pennispora]ORX71469.1 UPF0546 membrane protein C1orf91 [Linderina pennispora]